MPDYQFEQKRRTNISSETLNRCNWVRKDDQLMELYHDEEWGTPTHDDVRLFEIISLEIAQAGLSWLTILNKRAGYREAFNNFDFHRIANYDYAKIESLLTNVKIVRNRLKILATINNAARALEVRDKFGSLDAYFWRFAPLVQRNAYGYLAESAAMSKQLRSEGWKFIGPTICNSFMQAAGLINDHDEGCFRRFSD